MQPDAKRPRLLYRRDHILRDYDLSRPKLDRQQTFGVGSLQRLKRQRREVFRLGDAQQREQVAIGKYVDLPFGVLIPGEGVEIDIDGYVMALGRLCHQRDGVRRADAPGAPRFGG